jgi:hypothetical protein
MFVKSDEFSTIFSKSWPGGNPSLPGYLGVVFRSVVHVDPVDQVFLDPVTAEPGILLLDVSNGLIEIEQLSIRPDKFASLGVELRVLHRITGSVGELGKLRNYQNLKETVEAIGELSQELLRADRDAHELGARAVIKMSEHSRCARYHLSLQSNEASPIVRAAPPRFDMQMSAVTPLCVA